MLDLHLQVPMATPSSSRTLCSPQRQQRTMTASPRSLFARVSNFFFPPHPPPGTSIAYTISRPNGNKNEQSRANSSRTFVAGGASAKEEAASDMRRAEALRACGLLGHSKRYHDVLDSDRHASQKEHQVREWVNNVSAYSAEEDDSLEVCTWKNSIVNFFSSSSQDEALLSSSEEDSPSSTCSSPSSSSSSSSSDEQHPSAPCRILIRRRSSLVDDLEQIDDEETRRRTEWAYLY